MKKREAEFTLLFRHYLKAHPMFSAVFELKQTTTDSISFSSVKEHQINALLAVNSKNGFLYKIPDDSIGMKPFDMIYYLNAPSYIVILYPRSFSIISVGTFLLEKERSKRKSLTEDRAAQISVRTVKTKTA